VNSSDYSFQKVIVLDKLNIYNLLYISFFRIFFFKIFYIELSNSLKKAFIVKFLSKINIYWINYQDFEITTAHSNKVKKNTIFCDYISKLIVNRIWSVNLKKYFLNKNFLEACLISKIKCNSEIIFETFEISRILAKNNFLVFIIIKKNFFFKIIRKKYYHKDNFFCISNIDLSLLHNLFNFIIFFIKKINFIIISKLTINSLIKNKANAKSYDYKTIFFPHKGMFYLNNLKDIFYSENNVFFKKQSIIHAEWNSKDINDNTINFYKNNNINFIFWDTFITTKNIFLFIFDFAIKNLVKLIDLSKYDIFFYIISSAYHIDAAEQKLSRFHNLKIALVAHDILFPIELSIALKKKNIISIAVQDRINIASWSNKMIFDHYFVLGSQSLRILKYRMSKTISNFHKSYLLKIDKINLLKNNYSQKRYRKKNFNCLVIDFHSFKVHDWYLNGRAINNWKDNNNFYKFVIKLSKKYENINFLIKSKDYNWMHNKYFNEVLNKVYNSKNIKILKNFTPEKSLLKADFGLARYSSLSDELLYLGKPLIIYDLGGYPSNFFNFSKRIICHNEFSVEKKIDKLLKNFQLFNKAQDIDRKKIFYYNSIEKLHFFLKKLSNSF
jgi:hypothetical protein